MDKLAATLVLAIGFWPGTAICQGAATALPQEELFNYGQEWTAFSNPMRWVYLRGFVDGQSNTYLAMIDDVQLDRRETLRLQTFTFFDAVALSAVMTSLYADPANAFIRYEAMVYIARDKLNGNDVEPSLRHARETKRGFTRQR